MMKNGLNSRQNSFVKHIASGNNATKSAILAGYSTRSARFTASKLLTNHNVLQRIEEIFDKAGLSDNALVARLKAAIDAGIGQKANNSDAIKGLKLAFELKGRLDKQVQIEATQEDEIHMKLSAMSNDELADHLESINQKTQEIAARLKERRVVKMNGDDSKLPALPVKVNLSNPEVIGSFLEVAVPQSQDTVIKRAVGIRVESKLIMRPIAKSVVNTNDSEDNVFRQKVNYPA